MSAATGVLVVWTDVIVEHETEFNAWYGEQHLPERLAVPGFRNVRRYVGDAAPKYLTYYETDSPDVLASERYKERLANPTEWTQRVMPWFINTKRCACRVIGDFGHGIGGVAQTITFSNEEAEEACPAWLFAHALPNAASHLGCVRVQLWRYDAAITDQPNPEAALRPQRDGAADRIVAIEAVNELALQEIAAPLLQVLRNIGAAQIAMQGPYQLLTFLRKE
jgi:hypothetical protein